MPDTAPKFVEAFRARNSLQAHVIRFALEDAGLRVVIENESLQDALGDLPLGWSTSPRLMVEESQLATAQEIIRHAEHHEDLDFETQSTFDSD